MCTINCEQLPLEVHVDGIEAEELTPITVEELL